MNVRFPLRLKIGTFAVVLVSVVCLAVGYLAVLRPALRDRRERVAEYEDTARIVAGMVAHQEAIRTGHKIHPDLVYIVWRSGGKTAPERCTVDGELLAEIDPGLAQQWTRDPKAALEALAALENGDKRQLYIKQASVHREDGDHVMDLGFSTASLDRALKVRLESAGIVLGASLLLAILGTLLLAGRITHPLTLLTRAMDRAGKGALEAVSINTGDEVGLLARAFNDMVAGLKERERLKSTLARYVSDDVAARILTERSDLDLKGEMREVTVLFLDIRGFTALAERLPPREVVSLLNEYFEAMIEVVFKHHGTVNKFMGDAVMAVFGAPFAIDDAPMRAVRAAVEIEQASAAISLARKQAGQPVVAVGIGINTGSAVAGNVGSERRMEYTVIGDEVNLAQRLEALAREGEILVSQSTYDKIRDRVQARAREPVQVKGKTIPIWVFEIVGLNA